MKGLQNIEMVQMSGLTSETKCNTLEEWVFIHLSFTIQSSSSLDIKTKIINETFLRKLMALCNFCRS